MMLNRTRIFILFFGCAAALCFVAVRLFCIQVWCHEELNAKVQRLVVRERPEQPMRGMITDRQGRVLAMSLKKYNVFVDPSCLEDANKAALELNGVGVHFDPAAIAGRRNSCYVALGQQVSYEGMQKIKEQKIAGIGFEPAFERQYPEGTMAAQVLGVVGKDGAGLEGIEKTANALLSGKEITELRYRDGRGREVADRVVDPEKLQGADVALTIDRNLQFVAEQEIEKAWKESGSKKGIAIIQDSQTGEILAMASRPAFDPAKLDSHTETLSNPAISYTVEPGSTFKFVMAAAALSENIVKRSEPIWCENGAYKIYDHTIKDHEKKGMLTFDQVLDYSSNIGAAKIGQRLGKEKLYTWARQFGFYSKTGVDLPGEERGLLKKPADWSGLSLPIISFGQEIGATPMQVVNAYTAMVNGGYLLEPKVILKVRCPDGKTLDQAQRQVIRRVVSTETSEQLKNMMIGVVEQGTGQMAKVPGYSVGGKTGTAQKRDPLTKKYSSSCYVASFCGAIPMNKPRLTIFVMLDEPKGDYYAASRAAPVFGKIASRAMRYLQIAPDQVPMQLARR